MAETSQQIGRYFVRLPREKKRQLDFLAVDAGVASTEEFGGRLLAAAIEKRWRSFNPKRRVKAPTR